MSELIFNKTLPGAPGFDLPLCDVPEQPLAELIPESYLRNQAPNLPELPEREVVKHYTGLSRQNFGVDNGFYPLGSCTMKYNPKVNEDLARLDGFTHVHPYQPAAAAQGCLQLMYELQQYLAEIAGVAAVSLQPAAGAQGELAGMLMVREYFRGRGEGERRQVIIPDSAHGTNPASAIMAGFEVIHLKSNRDGMVDPDTLRQACGPRTAALMLTNPNTLGLFEGDILTIAQVVHEAGGLLYYDGANLNAIIGKCRPGDMGFDIVHFNLHKTFGTPHGGGGPGSGPVGVKKELAGFLPTPVVVYDPERQFYDFQDLPASIGKLQAFNGNFSVLVKAYAYIRALGAAGLDRVSSVAVLNANYLKYKLNGMLPAPYPQTCMHEFVVSPDSGRHPGLRTLDLAKRLIDYGYHPPTIYFPLIVEEALMIEPTETETKATLDQFITDLGQILEEYDRDPVLLQEVPRTTSVSRLDETAAARKPVLRWRGRQAT